MMAFASTTATAMPFVDLQLPTRAVAMDCDGSWWLLLGFCGGGGCFTMLLQQEVAFGGSSMVSFCVCKGRSKTLIKIQRGFTQDHFIYGLGPIYY
ncbi:hypothetical protein Hanom_Chr04g00307601 [Helianthus anomalus]